MTSIACMSQTLKQLFEHDSVELARAAGLRQRKLTFVQLALILVVGWDRLLGRLHGPSLQEGRRHELSSVLRERVIVPGSLWLADLGYWNLKWLRALSQAGVYFLMRSKAGIVLWHDKQRLDLLRVLPQVEGDRLELS